MADTPDRPLHILVLIHRQNDTSPYCFYVHDQVCALRAAGHTVTVISPIAALPGYRWLRPAAARILRATPQDAVVDGIPVHYPRYAALGNAGLRLLGGLPEYLAALPIARRLHREKPFDILHAHMLPMDGHAGLLLSRALGIPLALTVHGTDVLRYFPKPWRRNRRIAQRADVLMAVSGMLAARVAPYRTRPVEVVHNGIDLSLVPARCENRPRRIVSGGTLKARKCMHTTLDAFSALAEQFHDATLTIFGTGEDEASLRAKVAARSLENRVQLVGGLPHAKVLQLMGESDAFVMPSYGEGFGIVYIEAMAAGCVAVGSVGEGIAEVITDGVNGYLVPAADTEALIARLRAILHSGSDVEAVRLRGIQTARAMTWAVNAERCTALYRAALENRRTGR